MGETAVAPGILAVDVGADRTGDAGMRFGRTGREREQAVMDRPVYIDESGAGLDGDAVFFLVDVEDAVHVAHVEQGLAVVEGQVSITAAGPAHANGHVVSATVCQRLAALFDRRRPRDKGARPN